MKKFIFTLSACISILQTNALTLFEQLCYFNSNWKKYETRASKEMAVPFASDKEYVQQHLEQVLLILHSNPTAAYNQQQLQSRQQLIELLSRYREAGNFPQNLHCEGRVPVFIDDAGTHCAVAYLLQQTGQEEVAKRIAARYNYDWLKDIHDEALPGWQQASGLSPEELKLIQGAYSSYIPGAFTAPNKYEIPQKPAVMLVHFGEDIKKKNYYSASEIWCQGEGSDGVLNGKWIQNFAVGKPWIEGYYEKGKRTGLWKEYFQGTHQLCRTENWRNDQLNGIRKRYNQTGQLIEEILFKDGKAKLKTNYDLNTSLKYIRQPLDSATVYTEIYTIDGLLLATGKEKIYNPGNLQWFQNIELTALNTISVAASRIGQSGGAIPLYSRPGRPQLFPGLYDAPPLVEYRKEGSWTYYREYNFSYSNQPVAAMADRLHHDFFHFGPQLYAEILHYDKVILPENGYDSVSVTYTNNQLKDFMGYSSSNVTHLKLLFTPTLTKVFDPFVLPETYGIRAIGPYTKEGMKSGEWRHYDERGTLYKTELFLVPRKEEEFITAYGY